VTKTVERFARQVREIENVFITLSDGCRLAARIWLPADAEENPVPAILEFLPYRKRDGTAPRDALTHPWFAGHGYAGVRVDMRGSGESDGILEDEYLKQEQDDCLEVLRWIAAQSWCTGKIGMMGISWGGFNGLQVAARRPPELKAVVTLASTDDRYADDVHFMGGCLINDNMAWGSAMFSLATHPADPALVGEVWRAQWLQRLENEPLLIDTWTRHQRRDAYWKHGSVCEDYGAIEAAVYAVGGWADGYTNAVPRLLAGLKSPKKGLVGPWAHKYPHFAKPGPTIGFLQEALRWWDQWLKGIDTGIMDEPEYRVWMQDWVPPAPYYAERPGRWVAEDSWPSPNAGERRLVLNPGRLDDVAGPAAVIAVQSPMHTGLASGKWCPYGLVADQAADQREDDGKSVVFDSAPLGERLEILGAPVVELELSADRPNALVAVRLNDVAPDGSSLRVSYGLLNLTHRDSHETPAPLEPGRRYKLRLKLTDIAHAFPAGHRIRVAVSNAYWPIAWPSPEPVTLTLHTGASALLLPVRKPRAEDAGLAPFPPAEATPPEPMTALKPGADRRSWTRDIVTGETVLVIESDDGRTRFDTHGLVTDGGRRSVYRIGGADPNSASLDIAFRIEVGRGDWQVRTRTRAVFRSTPTEFLVDATLDAWEGEVRVCARNWSTRIPRDLV
jgi:hypothetical protein